MLNVFRQPSVSLKINKNKIERTNMVWKKPNVGEVKFNANGTTNGCPSEAGIRGIMRKEDGECFLRFSKYINVEDSNMAEIMAIKMLSICF